MFVNRCLNLCHCNKTYSIKIDHFTKITYARYQALPLVMDVGRDVHVRANINQLSVKHGFYSLHSFSTHDLRVSISLNPGIDIAHIESAFIQVQCFNITL